MDNTTLFVAFLGLSCLSCLVLSVLLVLSGRRFRGVGLWITAQAMNAAAPLMDLARPILPPWFLVVVPSVVYLAACPFYFHALWAFRFESPFPRWVYLWVPLEILSFVLLFEAPLPDQTQYFSLWLAVGMLSCGAFLVWKPPRAFRVLFGLAAIPFFLVGLTSLTRIVVNLVSPFFWGGSSSFVPADFSYTARYILVPAFLLFSYFILSRIQAEQVVVAFESERVTGDPSPVAVAADLDPPESPLDDRVRHFKISAREWEVARMVLDGLQSKEIADRLFISMGTVKTHLQRLFRKTGCMNRAELVRTLLVGRKAANQRLFPSDVPAKLGFKL